MKSFFTLVSVTVAFSLSAAAPAADALPAALMGAPPLCDLPGPPIATLVKDVSVAELITAQSANSTLHKRADGTFQAFSGDFCDRDIGEQLGFGGGPRCIDCRNRHSFAVLGCRASVTLFELDECRGRYTSAIYEQGCYNVNTGYNWGSSSVYCI